MNKFLTGQYLNRWPLQTVSALNSSWIALFVVSQSVLGGFVMVDSANISSSNELLSFVAGGRTVTQAELIQPTLSAFRSRALDGVPNIAIPVGGILPTGTARSQLTTHDFRLDTTGTANTGSGDAAAITFSVPLVNGPGADLVYFLLSSDAPIP